MRRRSYIKIRVEYGRREGSTKHIIYFPNPHAEMYAGNGTRASFAKFNKNGQHPFAYAYPFKTLIYLSLYILCTIYLCSSM